MASGSAGLLTPSLRISEGLRGRVHPLATGIHEEGSHQEVRHATEKTNTEPFGGEKAAIVPQGLLA